MTPIRKLLAACVLAGVGVASAADLDLRVRPTLPPEIRTVQQAIAYYLEPAGYSFVATDATYGDFGDLASRPVARTAPDNQPLPIRDAILAVLPDSVVLYIDTSAQRVILGRRPASARDARDRVHYLDQPRAVEAPAAFEAPTVAAEPQLAGEPDTPMPSPDAAGFVDIAPEPDARPTSEPDSETRTEPMQDAEPVPASGFSLRLVAGETLSTQLAKAAPEGYQIVWRAPNDLMVAANATISAGTFEDTVVQALRALWHTRNALIVSHYANNVLVITAP